MLEDAIEIAIFRAPKAGVTGSNPVGCTIASLFVSRAYALDKTARRLKFRINGS
jgi:hypothetical protein